MTIDSTNDPSMLLLRAILKADWHNHNGNNNGNDVVEDVNANGGGVEDNNGDQNNNNIVDAANNNNDAEDNVNINNENGGAQNPTLGTNQILEEIQGILNDHPTVLSTPVNNEDLGEFFETLEEATPEVAWCQRALNVTQSTMYQIGFLEDDESTYPLHWCVFLGLEDISLLILDAYPQAASKPTNFKLLPIHLAMETGRRNIILRLLDVYPEGAKAKSSSGNLPLHYPFEFDITFDDVEIFQRLLEAHPYAIDEGNNYDEFPIHCAIKHGHSLDIIKLLFEANPLCAFNYDCDCHTPIIASMKNYDQETFLYLLEANDYSDLLMDFPKEYYQHGRNHNNHPMIQLLRVEEQQRAATMAKISHLPILQSCIKRSNPRGVAILLECMQKKNFIALDDYGRNPILCLIEEASTKETELWDHHFLPILKSIMKYYHPCQSSIPEVTVRDGENDCSYGMELTMDNRHFLHIAADVGLPWSGTEMIINLYKDALLKVDSKTGLLPFMLALAEDNDDGDDDFISPPSKSCLSSGFEMLRMRPDLLVMQKVQFLNNDGDIVMEM